MDITIGGITYEGVEVEVLFGAYWNMQTALRLMDEEGEVSRPSVALDWGKRGELWLKDYSENAGVPAELERRGLVELFERRTVGPYGAEVVRAELRGPLANGDQREGTIRCR